MQRIGVISDTHGLLRPEAVEFLEGSAQLIHAGDVGSADVLKRLAALAPLTAVRGNNDTGAWAKGLGETGVVDVGPTSIFVLHEIAQLRRVQLPLRARVVVYGHSHQPVIEERDGVLYLNPGSAGPRRFKLPVSVAELVVGDDGSVAARIHELSVTPVSARTPASVRRPIRRRR
jgi:putative phosphoesterase